MSDAHRTTSLGYGSHLTSRAGEAAVRRAQCTVGKDVRRPHGRPVHLRRAARRSLGGRRHRARPRSRRLDRVSCTAGMFARSLATASDAPPALPDQSCRAGSPKQDERHPPKPGCKVDGGPRKGNGSGSSTRRDRRRGTDLSGAKRPENSQCGFGRVAADPRQRRTGRRHGRQILPPPLPRWHRRLEECVPELRSIRQKASSGTGWPL